jgi:Ni/Fe-hydrogenase b-type cytochrome subunit
MTAPATAPEPLTTKHPQKPSHRWVYLWHLPVRAMHWIAAVAVVVLIVTGFYIGKPYFMTSGEASDHFLMGWMRFLHFVSAGVLIATGIVRIYWLFVGNRFEAWRALLPYHRRDWIDMWRVFVKYLLIFPERAPHYMGHNPLQQVSYTALYAIVLVQIVTGFAMYGQSNPDGMIYALFHWIVPVLGGAQIVRFIHHVLTWVFVIFIPIHIYLTVRADALHREGRISSMVSGGRFVREDLDYVDE